MLKTSKTLSSGCKEPDISFDDRERIFKHTILQKYHKTIVGFDKGDYIQVYKIKIFECLNLFSFPF